LKAPARQGAEFCSIPNADGTNDVLTSFGRIINSNLIWSVS
jgi:hypothetical protein